ADLWCSVYPDLPLAQRQHRSSLLTRLESCIRALPKGAELQLPERIFVFGLSALPPRMLAVIKALAEHIDIHVVVNNPCRYYWGDVMSEYQQLLLNQSLLARGVSAETVAENFIEHNTLLASWGKLGRDYMSLLMQEEIFADLATELYDDLGDEDNSALNLIQSDILNLQNQHHCVNPDDKSIRFASCHNHLREVEALHDYLLNTLDANPGLNARDIIVMVPDIEDYAAYIEA
ncbi:exodeoxyribonuclease V subunit gamma, partial [Oleiphilus sp. HI0086]